MFVCNVRQELEKWIKKEEKIEGCDTTLYVTANLKAALYSVRRLAGYLAEA